MIHWPDVQYFKREEFASPDDASTADKMDARVVFGAVALRKLLKRPIIINSAYRTPSHNAAVGGAPRSAHMEGLAIDINTRKWSVDDRRDLIVYAEKLGFNGIGIAPTFIHLDMKARRASWIYVGKGQQGIAIGQETKYL